MSSSLKCSSPGCCTKTVSVKMSDRGRRSHSAKQMGLPSHTQNSAWHQTVYTGTSRTVIVINQELLLNREIYARQGFMWVTIPAPELLSHIQTFTLNTNSNIFSLKNALPKMYLKNFYGTSMKLYNLYSNNDDAGIMLPQINMALKKS